MMTTSFKIDPGDGWELMLCVNCGFYACLDDQVVAGHFFLHHADCGSGLRWGSGGLAGLDSYKEWRVPDTERLAMVGREAELARRVGEVFLRVFFGRVGGPG